MAKNTAHKKQRDWESFDREGAMERAAALRWAAKGKAQVTHPRYGTVIVPCQSPIAAVFCTAEVWGSEVEAIEDYRVLSCDQSLPAEKRPEKKQLKKTWMVIHGKYGFLDTLAEDPVEALKRAAQAWGEDPRTKEFQKNCIVRKRN